MDGTDWVPVSWKLWTETRERNCFCRAWLCLAGGGWQCNDCGWRAQSRALGPWSSCQLPSSCRQLTRCPAAVSCAIKLLVDRFCWRDEQFVSPGSAQALRGSQSQSSHLPCHTGTWSDSGYTRSLIRPSLLERNVQYKYGIQREAAWARLVHWPASGQQPLILWLRLLRAAGYMDTKLFVT